MKVPGIFKFSKKKIIVLVIPIIVAFIGFNIFFKPKQPILQFATVLNQDIKSTVSSSGSLTGKTSANLKFKSGGKVAYLNVKAGDKVFVGQALAGLDTQDLAIALQQAQNTFVAKDAAAKKAEDDVKNHSSDESFSQKETRTAAQVARDNAYDAVKAAQRNFQDAVIVSPINGIVTQAAVSVPGQNITASDLIAQVVDFSQLYFDTEIDEADISKIALGQTAEVILDAYPDKILAGKVVEIIPQTKTTSAGSSVITIRINLDSPEITPVNGLSGQATIIISEAKGVLILPQEAVREDNTVFIQTPQGLQSKKVETGIKSDTDVEIKSGLSGDERVLLNPPATGNRINQNRNPIQTAIFRIFGGPRGAGGAR